MTEAFSSAYIPVRVWSVVHTFFAPIYYFVCIPAALIMSFIFIAVSGMNTLTLATTALMIGAVVVIWFLFKKAPASADSLVIKPDGLMFTKRGFVSFAEMNTINPLPSGIFQFTSRNKLLRQNIEVDTDQQTSLNPVDALVLIMLAIDRWKQQRPEAANLKKQGFYESWGARLLGVGFLLVGFSCIGFLIYTCFFDSLRDLPVKGLMIMAFGAFMFTSGGVILVTGKGRNYSS